MRNLFYSSLPITSQISAWDRLPYFFMEAPAGSIPFENTHHGIKSAKKYRIMGYVT